MKILVTGHCGFIGQNFVRLFKDKYEIIGFDKLGYASDPNAFDLCEGMVGDLAKADCVDDFFKKYGPFSYIYHFAAESHVDNSINSPEPFIQSNIIGTFNLLEAVRKYNKDATVVIIGTDEEYGSLNYTEPPFTTVSPLFPSSPYSASKASASLLGKSYNTTYGLWVVFTKSVNNYGPYQYYEKLIPVVINCALNDKPIPVYGNGKNVREWIFVEDNCKGILEAGTKSMPGMISFIGTGNEFSNIDLIKMILKLMNKPESLISFIEDRKGHDKRYALDSKHYPTPWEPKIDIYTGLEKTIEWYMNNKNYWRTND